MEIRCEKCKGAINESVLVHDDGHDLLFYHIACYEGVAQNFHELIQIEEMTT